jgi:putative transcriptional regulator
MMVIRNRVKILIAEKEHHENRKLTYRTISQETGISTSTLTAFMSQKVESYASSTIEKLCQYFNCLPGDIIEYVPDLDQVPGVE